MKITMEDLRYWIGESNMNIDHLLELLHEILTDENAYFLTVGDVQDYAKSIGEQS